MIQDGGCRETLSRLITSILYEPENPEPRPGDENCMETGKKRMVCESKFEIKVKERKKNFYG
jgi:hypothetical protein